MLYYTSLIILAFAVSFDSIFVGITYGMKRIYVPYMALLIITLNGILITYISMTIGINLSHLISHEVSKLIGGLILILIGSLSLYNARNSKNCYTKEIQSANLPQESIDKNRINVFVLMLTILKKPVNADIDSSNTISMKEAFLLGFALALDAFGAGLGAGMIGYSPIVTPLLIGVMGGLFIKLGIKFGSILSKIKIMQRIAYLAPCILIIIGLNMLPISYVFQLINKLSFLYC